MRLSVDSSSVIAHLGRSPADAASSECSANHVNQSSINDVVSSSSTGLLTPIRSAASDRTITNQFSIDAVVSLVSAFSLGLQTEAVGGATDGHAELLTMIDERLQ